MNEASKQKLRNCVLCSRAEYPPRGDAATMLCLAWGRTFFSQTFSSALTFAVTLYCISDLINLGSFLEVPVIFSDILHKFRFISQVLYSNKHFSWNFVKNSPFSKLMLFQFLHNQSCMKNISSKCFPLKRQFFCYTSKGKVRQVYLNKWLRLPPNLTQSYSIAIKPEIISVPSTM